MERCGFFDARLVDGDFDRVYLATHFASYFASFVGNGVFAGKAQQLQVLADNPNSMKVKVMPGQGWINGYWYENTEDKMLSIEPADGILKRIDNVVLRLDLRKRVVEVVVEKGESESSPAAPRLRRDIDAYDLLLATINVGASISKIMQSNITDTRADSSVCGWVTGLIEQVNTENLYMQYQAYYEDFKQRSNNEWVDFKNGKKTDFEEWFEEIKTQLAGNIAGNLQNQITNLTNRVENVESKNNNQDSSLQTLKTKSEALEQIANKAKKIILNNVSILQADVRESNELPLYKYSVRVNISACKEYHIPKVYFKDRMFFADVVKSYDGYILLFTNYNKFGSGVLSKVILERGD